MNIPRRTEKEPNGTDSNNELRGMLIFNQLSAKMLGSNWFSNSYTLYWFSIS